MKILEDGSVFDDKTIAYLVLRYWSLSSDEQLSFLEMVNKYPVVPNQYKNLVNQFKNDNIRKTGESE